MKVRHKVSGKEFEVSEDYFERYVDVLEVLEKVETKPKKKTTKKKQTKVVEPSETETKEDGE